MLGDVLRKHIKELADTSTNKKSRNAFWIVLREIARKEIIEYDGKIDSNEIIPIYYSIMTDNLDSIPEYFQKVLPSNNQERYRVIIRNMFSSNAFHPDGLANQESILAYKEINENIKGEKIVFQKR